MPGRGLALLLLTLGLLWPAAAQARVDCRGLVKAIDEEIAFKTPYARAYRKYGNGFDPEGVIDYIGFSFMSWEHQQLAMACWQTRKDRPVDANTRSAVVRASRFALWSTAGKERIGYDLYPFGAAFMVERATGVDGPISQALRRDGVSMLLPKPSRDLAQSIDISMLKQEISAFELHQATIRLAAICLADPAGFRGHVAAIGFPREMLMSHPSRLVNETDPDTALQLAYLDWEMDRILTECPA